MGAFLGANLTLNMGGAFLDENLTHIMGAFLGTNLTHNIGAFCGETSLHNIRWGLLQVKFFFDFPGGGATAYACPPPAGAHAYCINL